MRDRFTASGYTERADTILYAGRDVYPSYPTDDWAPVFYDSVYSVVREYTTPFGASVVLNASLQDELREKYGLEVLSPVEDVLLVSSRQLLPEALTITLYDMSGKNIFAKKLDRLPAGRTEISLGALEMPQGVYIYQIEATEFHTGGKLIKR